MSRHYYYLKNAYTVQFVYCKIHYAIIKKNKFSYKKCSSLIVELHEYASPIIQTTSGGINLSSF